MPAHWRWGRTRFQIPPATESHPGLTRGRVTGEADRGGRRPNVDYGDGHARGQLSRNTELPDSSRWPYKAVRQTARCNRGPGEIWRTGTATSATADVFGLQARHAESRYDRGPGHTPGRSRDTGSTQAP